MTDPQQPKLLRVCRIGRAQGLKGEVNVRAFTDEPDERFAPGSVLLTGDGREFTVVRSRLYKNRWIVLFEGIGDRNASEALNGTDLYVPADSIEEMEDEDAFYPEDLIGLRTVAAAGNAIGLPEGHEIGEVADVLESPAQWLLTIRTPDGEEALVPFVEQIVPDVDLEEGVLTLDPPGGLIPGL